MARLGITYHEIADAAQQLSALGKPTTVENIRGITGTGSNSTIANHLKAWKQQRDNIRAYGDTETVPEEIIRLVKGLWQRLMTEANSKITDIQEACDEIVSDVKAKLEISQTNHAHLQQQHNQLHQEKEKHYSDKLALAQTVKLLEQENVTAKIAHEKIELRLQEKQSRIEELQRLHQQAQTNLEHYRETSREQRLQEQQQNAQREAEQAHTIQVLQQERTLINQQLHALQKNHDQLLYTHDILKNQHEQLNKQHETLTLKLKESDKIILQQTHTAERHQIELQTLQNKFDTQHKELMKLQMEFAVLMQQQSDAQTNLKILTEQNQHLAHEKWILSQEKAQLEGQLKQVHILSV